jgi:hydrophobe/amphiphile efflux-1 (HAE1) family protein
MWISDFSIRNPVVTTVLMLSFVVFGAVSLLRLETDEFPTVQPPVVAVTVPYPGAAPETVEREVVHVMEEAFTSISGVKKVSSTSMDSLGVIIVEYVFEKDLQQASQDIRDKISEVRRDLPLEMEEPVLKRFDPADLPIVSLTLSSPRMGADELTRIADPGLTDALRSIKGVAEVKVVGGVERELEVELNPVGLQAAGVGVGQVVEALAAQNLAAPVGRVTAKSQERTIRLRGRFATPREFEQLVVATVGDRVVRLGQVAAVRDGTEEPRSAAFLDGRRAVGLDVVKATGSSTTAVSKQVIARVHALQKTLPKGAKLDVVRDAGVRVANSVRDVESSLFEGALLTVLVVFLFLSSWRSTVITGLALPVSVLASFIAVWAMGFTLNTMSLLGLSLAIGILIDDAIVVRENIVRHMQMGKDHVTAAREGTAEIGLAVAATTFSIVVVFVPVAFMGGIAQQWFAPFALTIACSVLVSLLVSFSLDPMLSSAWPDPAVEQGKHGFVTRHTERFNRWFDRRAHGYTRVIGWALDHRLAMAAIAFGTFVVALMLPVFGVVGGEFFPLQDRSEFILDLRTPPGSSLEYTAKKTLETARLSRELPEVRYTYATIGGQTGEAVDEASVYVRLSPKSQRSRKQDELAALLRARVGRVAGLRASLATGGLGPQRQIQLQVTGPDLGVLSRTAAAIEAEVRKVRGAVDVGLSSKGQKPELEVVIDRALAGELGISAAQVAQALRPAFAGVDAGDWIDPGGETRDVTVRLSPGARRSVSDLRTLPLSLTAAGGKAVLLPLGQVAQVRQELGPAQISHLDRQRVITVEANTEQRPLNQVVRDIERRVSRMALPPGYATSQGGETQDQQEVFGRIALALGVAVTLMYLILVIQFRSFLDPLAIMASLPLSLIGVMLALLVTGSTLNLMSLIGVILLVGIVAKNAILLIDFAKWAEAGGKTRHEAIVEAGRVRLRPICMTSLAIVAGMIPVAIGSGEGADFRAPLGRAVIGGVVTSTLLTLLVIPTLYDVLAGLRDRVRGWFSARRRHGPRAPQPAE